VLAIVPVNAPAEAKRRLATLLDAAARAALVRAMLADVVSACREARSISRVLVVTPDPGLAEPGCEVLADRGLGHAAALADALRHPLARADGALVVMADCPLVRAASLDALAQAARPVALAPAQDGGTNAIALRPADAVEPAFGLADGAALTVARARERGFEAVLIDDPLIALDVDTPEDVRRVLELGAGTATHRLLAAALAEPSVAR
jgi:2-phospho-L-lactate guanylyltransferase